MKQLTKSHFFWKYGNGTFSLFNRSKEELYNDILIIIKFSYLFFLFALFVRLGVGNRVGDVKMYSPLWAVVFLSDIPSNYLYLFFHINLFLSFSLLCFYPNRRVLKIYAFIIYLLYTAFLNSFGKINHELHLPLMILFCFMFIPQKTVSEYKEKTILIFATTQFFLLFAYSLTGAWKLFWGVIEFFTKEVSLFSPLSFRNVLITQYQNVNPTIVGEFLLEHYVVGWLFYLVAIYIEFFSIFIFFRANLHRFWGFLLLGLHFGIHLILDVNMFTAPLVLGLLMIMSPFNVKTGFKTTVLSLPIIKELNYCSLWSKIK